MESLLTPLVGQTLAVFTLMQCMRMTSPFGPTVGMVGPARRWSAGKGSDWVGLLSARGAAGACSEPVAGGAGLDDVGVEGQPVHDRGGEPRVGEGGAPPALSSALTSFGGRGRNCLDLWIGVSCDLLIAS